MKRRPDPQPPDDVIGQLRLTAAQNVHFVDFIKAAIEYMAHPTPEVYDADEPGRLAIAQFNDMWQN